MYMPNYELIKKHTLETAQKLVDTVAYIGKAQHGGKKLPMTEQCVLEPKTHPCPGLQPQQREQQVNRRDSI